jgi:hypothetical protein
MDVSFAGLPPFIQYGCTLPRINSTPRVHTDTVAEQLA